PDLQPVNVTVLGGVSIGGLDQDGRVGRALDRPLTVRLEKAPGEYVAAGEGMVRFTLMNAPEGTSLSATVRRTDEDGTAATDIKLGKTQGRVDVAINILSGLNGSNTSVLAPIETHFFAIDFISVTISILGGLALFLFGMRMLSESLQFVAGDKLRAMLNLLTTNRFMAVGAGAMITALIQSSSACTVMVVGFVNAGLMKLEQAIGVIMGANIGTTITAQIIALKLSALAMPAIAIGVAILLFSKRRMVQYQASILIGFGILFLGLNLMSAELGQLKNSETVVSLFRGLDAVPGASGYVPLYPFLKAVFYGLIVTLILQSSSATIGLLITVAAAGLIDPFAAFGILLGDNIGTTITALLASIGTSTAAKRAAVFHLTFNVLGCLLMMGLNFIQWPGMHGRPVFMELANRLTSGDVFVGAENLPRFIANAHTLFNLTCTALFISCVPQFARLCRWLVKPSGEDLEVNDARRILEPHLLATPSLALQQVWTEVGIMLEKAREAQNEGYQALIAEPDSDWSSKAREAKNLEKETDELKAAITKYLGGISLTTLNENQSEMFPHLVRTVNDAERVADLGKHLSKLAKRVNKRSLSLTPEAIDDMNAMMALVNELLELAEKTVNINADGIEMSGGGAVLRGKLLDDGYRLAKQAKAKASTLRKNHEAHHEQGLCDIKSGVVFLDVANSLARSAGCAINIIEAACHTATPSPGKSPPSRRMTVRNTRVGQ
ncbi:MAG: Na/Pi cotransporter family protein, partial [Planctomycetes bacterium]|nr:Na/Pi cotransporter family protein [Planctomycetota bacterium]